MVDNTIKLKAEWKYQGLYEIFMETARHDFNPKEFQSNS